MAKAVAPGISDETKEIIDNQVKKGQPRKFFLIYKGTEIKTLAVFKKGPFGAKVMQAKKDGFKGDVAYGIVIGSGQNLCFQLPGNGDVAEAMKVDSWDEEPPTKEVKLRAFLIDNGLHFKANYSIIHQVSSVVDPEADTDIKVGDPGATEATAEQLSEGSEVFTSDAELEAACKQIKLAVYPSTKVAIGTYPDRKDDIIRLLGLASKHEKAREFQEAIDIYQELRSLIDHLTSGGDQFELLYDSLLETLPHELQRLREVNGTAADRIQKVIDGAASHAEKGEFKSAFNYLEKAVEAIAKAMGAARVEEAANVIPAGKVAQMKAAILNAKIRWDDGIKKAAAEMQKVQDGIREQDPELSAALSRILIGYQKELADVLTVAEKAQHDDGTAGYLRQALELAAKLKTEFATDDVFALLNAYPETNVDVQGPLDNAIAEVRRELNV